MKKLGLLSLILSLFILTGTIAFAADPVKLTSSPAASFSVLSGVEDDIDQGYSISLFKRILVTADLEDMIKYDATKTGFTLFAPTDQALRNDLTLKRRQELLTNKEAARYFVMFHMTSGKKSVDDLTALSGKELMSMSKTALSVTSATSSVTGKIRLIINGAINLAGPFEGTNNVNVYIIDTVVTP